MKLYKPEEYFYLYNRKKNLIIIENTLFLKNESLKISMCYPNILKFFVVDSQDWHFENLIVRSDTFIHQSFKNLFNEKYNK